MRTYLTYHLMNTYLGAHCTTTFFPTRNNYSYMIYFLSNIHRNALSAKRGLIPCFFLVLHLAYLLILPGAVTGRRRHTPVSPMAPPRVPETRAANSGFSRAFRSHESAEGRLRAPPRASRAVFFSQARAPPKSSKQDTRTRKVRSPFFFPFSSLQIGVLGRILLTRKGGTPWVFAADWRHAFSWKTRSIEAFVCRWRRSFSKLRSMSERLSLTASAAQLHCGTQP